MKDIQVVNNSQIQNQENNKEIVTSEILQHLDFFGVDNKKIAEKLSEWLDATTLNARGDVMPDNRAQQKAFEYIMKMKGIKMDGGGTNINFFNIPNPNEPLKY